MLNKYGLIILLLVSILVYINILVNGFIWDDEDLIMEDRFIHSPRYIGYLFSPKYWKQDFVAHKGHYRPLRAVTFVAEWRLWGKNPVGYHLTNLILNLVAVLGVYYLGQILFAGDDIKSFFSALLFAVHPGHSESICWIKNRTDILMTLFYVLAIGLFVKYNKMKNLSVKNLFIVGVLFILSLLSKEAAITFPLIVAAYLLIIEKETFGETLKKVLPFVIISALFLLFLITDLRTAQLKSPLDIKANFLALTQYLRILILPYDLNAERALVTGIDLIGPVFFAAVIYLVIKKKLYQEGFMALWVLITLIPALDIRFITSRPIAEQRLYLPSVGLCLLAGSVMSKKLWSRILLILVVVGFSVITFARNFDWRDSVKFWQKTVKQSPDSPRAWHNLGVGYERVGNFQYAVNMYEKAILLDPRQSESYVAIGNIAYNTNRLDIAESMFRKAIENSPESLSARYGLAKVFLDKKNFSDAERLYNEILELKPNEMDALNALGVIYSMKGAKEKAKAMFLEVLKIDEKNTEALYNLAGLYRNEGDLQKAKETYERVIKIDYRNADALNNLGVIALIEGRSDDAAEIFKKVVKQKPDYYPAHYNLGEYYYDKKMYLNALAEFARVLELKPDHQQAKLKKEKLKNLVEQR